MPTVKILKNHSSSLVSSDPDFSVLLRYFNFAWDFILKPKNENWQTISRYPLQPRTLRQYWLDSNLVIGLRFGQYTRYGCIDLDKSSDYHPRNNPKNYLKLVKALKKLGICQTVLIQSSHSEGVHLFFFLPKKVSSFSLACALTKVLNRAEIKLGLGQVEIFPNTKRYVKAGEGFSLYNGLRVPMQPGTGAKLLDPNTFEPVEGGIPEFCELIELCSQGQDFKLLNRQLKSARKWYKEHKKKEGWSHEDQWENDIIYRLQEGFTSSGQTNELLKELTNLGRVFRGKETVQDLAAFIEEEAIKLPRFKEHCGHILDISKRAWDWASAGIPFWATWKNHPDQRTEKYDQMRARLDRVFELDCDRPRKIFKGKYSRTNQRRHDAALDHLEQVLIKHPLDTLPGATGERLAFINARRKEMFGKTFSRATMMKPEYRQYWHPKHVMVGKSVEPKQDCIKSVESSRIKLIVTQSITRFMAIEYLSLSVELSQEKRKTRTPQPKSTTEQSLAKTIAPLKSSTTQNDLSEMAVSYLTKGVEKSDRTLMKCFVFGSPYLAYRVFILILNLIKAKSKSYLKLEIGFNSYQTSDFKLDLIAKAKSKASNNYFYNGLELNSRKGSSKKRNFLVPLSPGMRVRIVSDIHSSTLVDDCRPIMVYVKALDASTKEKYLVPLNSLINGVEKSCYGSALFPLIRDKAKAIGTTQSDFVRHLKTNYGVTKTSHLKPQQLFELFRYFQLIEETC